jgi:hypothetical protein
MNVLAIGNSFSQDATRYLSQIAKKDGDTLSVANLYIGGCSLETHFRNMLSNERKYTLEYNGISTGFSVSIDEALLNRHWDVITLQQVSHLSFNYDTYQPYLSALAEHIREYCPKAKILIHQTWAYEENSDKLINVAKYDTAIAMTKDIIKAYDKAAKDINAYGIIPSGELFSKLTKAGISQIHRDTFHASKGTGRYALGLLWYRIICNKSVMENMFLDFDEEISDQERDIIRQSVVSFSPIK